MHNSTQSQNISSLPSSSDKDLFNQIPPGYSRQFSQRLQRYYYFNHSTGQSFWNPEDIPPPQTLSYQNDNPTKLLMTEKEFEVFKKFKLNLGHLIEKEFIFDLSTLILPSISNIIFKTPLNNDSNLYEYKKRLIDIQSLLDDKDLSIWGRHTDLTNICRDIPIKSREIVQNEMSSIAWFKMYEMLCSYPLLSPFLSSDKPLSSLSTVHLCEAPGAFICATNHYIKTHSSLQSVIWEWKAISLNPYNEDNILSSMIDDDRFIIQTLSHWYWGEDNSGNILHPANITGLWKEIRKSQNKGIQMVTADGSVSCAHNPAEQENIVKDLHYAESVCAFGLLAKHGNFVIKMFTFFENLSISLLYLFNYYFKKVIISKPANSKSGNNETYVVCLDFQGISSQDLRCLLSPLSAPLPSLSLIPLSLFPLSFLSQIRYAASFFSTLSATVILNNIALFENMNNEMRNFLACRKNEVVEEFFHRFPVPPLPISCHIVNEKYLSGSKHGQYSTQFQNREDITGSLNERKALESSSNTSTNLSSEQNSSSVFNNPIVMKQMLQMGYNPDKGLGKSQQGRVEPIIPTPIPDKSGIGNSTSNQSDHLIHYLSSPNISVDTISTYLHSQTGPNVHSIKTSRWCDHQLLSNLSSLRKNLSQLDNLHIESKRQEIFQNTFPFSISNTQFSTSCFSLLIIAYHLPNLLQNSIVLDLSSDTLSVSLITSFSSLFHFQSYYIHPTPLIEKSSLIHYLDCDLFSSPLTPLQFHPSFVYASIYPIQSSFHSTLLSIFIISLSHLSLRGYLIIEVGDIFNRFMVGSLYLLSLCFEKVSLMKPILGSLSYNTLPVYLICVDYIGSEKSNIILQYFIKLKESNSEFNEIIDISLLLQEPYFSSITYLNKILCQNEIFLLDNLFSSSLLILFIETPIYLDQDINLSKWSDHISSHIKIDNQDNEPTYISKKQKIQ